MSMDVDIYKDTFIWVIFGLVHWIDFAFINKNIKTKLYKIQIL